MLIVEKQQIKFNKNINNFTEHVSIFSLKIYYVFWQTPISSRDSSVKAIEYQLANYYELTDQYKYNLEEELNHINKVHCFINIYKQLFDNKKKFFVIIHMILILVFLTTYIISINHYVYMRNL